MRFAEVVDSPESAKEFMKLNKITPREIIVVWDEDIDKMKKEDKMNTKGFFTSFGAFLLMMLVGFGIGAYHVIKWLLSH